jgi:RES domain-containing protein
MRVARLIRRSHAPSVREAYSGAGARLFGGRWNSRDVTAAYAAATVSLAALEILVNADVEELQKEYAIAYAVLPDAAIEVLKALPSGWNRSELPESTQRLGDAFLSGRRAVALAVPSVVVPTEFNYLINPAHPAFSRVRFERELVPFFFDKRLFAQR